MRCHGNNICTDKQTNKQTVRQTKAEDGQSKTMPLLTLSGGECMKIMRVYEHCALL